VRILAHAAVLAVVLVAPLARGEPKPPHAAVASAHPLATAAGLEILAAGGNAFDAAVAVSAALAVVEPASSGVGGGGFYLLHRPGHHPDTVVDARETAPAAARADLYLGADGKPIVQASREGALAAGIPGEPAGWAFLAARYGKLPLARSLAPAIKLAREGFPLYARLQNAIRVKKESLARSVAGRIFLSDGEVPAVGALIRQADLAATLELIANRADQGFYHGDFAERLVAGVRAAGGIWTAADMASYRVTERDALESRYGRARITTAPPPAGGVVLVDCLNILAGYDLKPLDGATRKHLLVEAMRHAFRDRAEYLGDPGYVSIPVAELTSPLYAAGQRASIRLDHATPSADLRPVGASAGEGQTTTHFSILDRAGNRVAATVSINLFFGSTFMVAGTGVVLNDTMDDFATAAGVGNAFGLVGAAANAVGPGRRPLSSMTPTFVETDQGLLIIGSPGGSTIITTVLQGVLAWLDGASPATIAAAPRLHHQYEPDLIRYEPGAISEEERARLAAMGHPLEQGRSWGNVELITWDYGSGRVEAAADPRGFGAGSVY
jgi:gamma-glutamyltranspeptidase / glutathione hydrolase